MATTPELALGMTRSTRATLLSALTMLGCGREPARVVENVAPPAASRAAREEVVSTFDVPLAYDFTNVIAQVERVVPVKFGSLSEMKSAGDRKSYAYQATRGRFTAYAQGEEVFLRSTLSYSARGSYDSPIGPKVSASCGTKGERPRIVVELAAPITLTPDWELRSKVRIVRIAAASDDDRDRCRMSFLNIDVTEKVLEGARKGLETQLPVIDTRISKVSLVKHATKWWDHLNAPIRLTENVWLLLQPKQLRLKELRGTGHTLNIEAGLDAVPIVVTGPRPVRVVLPLPPLGDAAGEDGFRVDLFGTVDFITASKALTKNLRGKRLDISGHSVEVRAVRAFRSPRGRLGLSVSFIGDAVGDVQFVGTPRINRSTDQIVVSDLDFDVATDNPLVNGYAWLRSETLVAFFRDQARFPSAPVIAMGSTLIEKGLNRTIGGVLTLAGQVDSLVVLGVNVEPAGLTIRAQVTGDASVKVRPKKPKPKATTVPLSTTRS